jgi:hypothetical protein
MAILLEVGRVVDNRRPVLAMTRGGPGVYGPPPGIDEGEGERS